MDADAPAGEPVPNGIESQIEVLSIDAAETRPLRQDLLRPHQTLDDLVYAGDDDADAGHFGAYAGDELIGITTVLQESFPYAPDRVGWRIRGMAVVPEWQLRGTGNALLQAALRWAADHGADLVWCNARSPSVGFYAAHGFATVGAEFDMPDIGPHYVMVTTVP